MTPIRDEAAQAAVVRFLESALPGPVTRIDTHISRLFLTPDRAFKLKRAVRLPYVDFTDPARRLASCDDELTLNAGHAPGLYLGTRDITAGQQGLALDGTGDTVDRVVEMRRFDEADLLSARAAAGRLTPALLDQTADAIAAMHAAAPPREGGGAAAMAAVLSINEAGFATGTVFDPARIARLNAGFRTALDARASALDARAAAGFHRRCHGDLHLNNLVVWQGRPCPFDAIEFNDDLATCDTGYDSAFLLMDLWQAGMPEGASRVTNRLADRGDEGVFPLLPFFMAVRAAVRAHVTATKASRAGDTGRPALTAEAERYTAFAEALLAPARPRLVALAGFSGSGKTTLAGALAPRLAPPPGARVIESDPTRKAMFGVSPETPLPEAAYTQEASDRVYAAMTARAEGLVAAGAPVILAAVHARAQERAATAAAAGRARFDGLDLSAPPEVLRARVVGRERGASDATAAVLEAQLACPAPGPVAGWRTLDASGSLDETQALCEAALGLSPRSGSPGSR